MTEDKIKWCLKQKRGIKITEVNENLSRSYIKEAELTLETMFVAKGKWKVITGYYACYNVIYSILLKIGIKCEMHECTIELMDILGFSINDIEFMKNLKQDRIDSHYYLKEKELKSENLVKEFISKCKQILDELNSITINKIRDKIENQKI